MCVAERTVLLFGEPSQVMAAQELVLARVQQDPWNRQAALGLPFGASPPPLSPHDPMQVRIVIPAPAAGAVIGRQGAHINALKDETGAYIKLVRKEESPVPNERLVNVSGPLYACVAVVNTVVARMAENPELSR